MLLDRTDGLEYATLVTVKFCQDIKVMILFVWRSLLEKNLTSFKLTFIALFTIVNLKRQAQSAKVIF